jgi:hypothetical protein
MMTVPSKGGTDLSSETAEQYIRRITAQFEGKNFLAVQAATAKKLERMIKGLSMAKLRKRPAPDKWSVNEIVAHLDMPGTPLSAVDQDSWLASGHYEKRDPHKSVELFRVVREANLALLKSLTPQQWKHYGMHSERGRETIKHILRMYAGHDVNHLRQIERILAAKRKIS